MTEGTQLLSCPHCLNSEVPRGAGVCTGCYAEVQYGPTSASKKIVLLGAIITAWFISSQLGAFIPKMDDFSLGVIIFFVVWVPARYLLAKKQANKVMFHRYYRR